MGRWATRLVAVVFGAIAGALLAAAAYAHVEVAAVPAVAGSANAVITFTAEAESSAAGIASIRVVLPTGISPTDVSLKAAPPGWTLTPGADGYTVGGKALPTGEEAVHSITVARLPDSTTLVFKVLVNYSNGMVDRWIEEPSTANPNPANPAPVLKLKPGTGPPPTTAAPTKPTTTAAASTQIVLSPTTGGGDGGDSSVWWLVGALVVAAAAAAWLIIRQRAATQGTSGER